MYLSSILTFNIYIRLCQSYLIVYHNDFHFIYAGISSVDLTLIGLSSSDWGTIMLRGQYHSTPVRTLAVPVSLVIMSRKEGGGAA